MVGRDQVAAVGFLRIFNIVRHPAHGFGHGKQKGIYFKVSEGERDLIEQKMALAGVRNMSGYIRKMAIDGYVVAVLAPVGTWAEQHPAAATRLTVFLVEQHRFQFPVQRQNSSPEIFADQGTGDALAREKKKQKEQEIA